MKDIEKREKEVKTRIRVQSGNRNEWICVGSMLGIQPMC